MVSSRPSAAPATFLRYLVTASLVRSPVLMAAVAMTTTTALALDDPDAGGRLAAVFVLGMLAGTPLAVAVQRRTSPRSLLGLQMVVAALSWGGLALLVLADASTTAWAVTAAVSGASLAGAAGLVRSTMTSSVPPRLLARASTLDALAQDVVVFLAPLVVALGALGGTAGAPAAVALVAFLAAVTVRATLGSSAAEQPVDRSRERRAGSRPVGTWAAWTLLSAAVGAALGAAEAGAVGLVADLGFAYTTAWVVFVLLGLASAVGAAVDIAVLHHRQRAPRLAAYVASLALGCLLVAARPDLGTTAVGVVLVGLPIAPLLGMRSHVFDGQPAPDRATGLTVSMAAQGIGFAAGAALLSVTGQPGALVVAVVLLVLGGGAALADLARTSPGPDRPLLRPRRAGGRPRR